MDRVLYGSQTSPYVRRIRLLMPADQYEFKKVDIFNPKERGELLQTTPLLKVPVLKWDQQILLDSRVIFYFLCQEGYNRKLNFPEENLLTVVNDVSDSLIQKMLAKRSRIEFPPGSPLEVGHSERISNGLTFLESKVSEGYFAEWSFLSMSLYSLIDWILFRELLNLERFPQLRKFAEENQLRKRVDITNPRIT